MPSTAPIPSARVIVWGLSLLGVARPILSWLQFQLTDDPATQVHADLVGFLALASVVTGVGLLLRGAWAVFTSYDAIAARYLGAGQAAEGASPLGVAPAPSPTGPQIRIPTSTEALSGTRVALSRTGPSPEETEEDARFRPTMPPLPTGRPAAPPAAPGRIVATPPPPSDDDA